MQTIAIGDHQWLTTVDTCSILNRSGAWLSLHHEEHNIRRVRVGSTFLYRAEDVYRVAVIIGSRKQEE